jgi:hypothetical protein
MNLNHRDHNEVAKVGKDSILAFEGALNLTSSRCVDSITLRGQPTSMTNNITTNAIFFQEPIPLQFLEQ